MIDTMTAKKPIILADQGSFTVSGATLKHSGEFSRERFLSPDGQTAYGDHAYVFYQIPENAKALPIVFQHGGAQSKRTWESTADGREGFQNMFLREGFSVYLVDQPRTGEAGLALRADDGRNPYAENPLYADKTLFELCRLGLFEGETPVLFKNSQFPQGRAAYEAFQRCWTPYAGQLDDEVNADALAALFEKVGPAVLFTHSMGGTVGWRTPLRTENVRAIVAFEPGGAPFVFPEDEIPEASPARFASISATSMPVPLAEFEKLARVPMLLVYGGNIAKEPSDLVGSDKWRSELDMARKFAATVNRHGGRAEVLFLPDIGIEGNTHFLMSDLNNAVIAGLALDWIHKHGLDGQEEAKE